MPLVRIDISKSTSRERVRDIGTTVYDAMTAVANVPLNDRFQVIARHDPDQIIYPQAGYLGIDYTPELVIILITWVSGRSTEAKKSFTSKLPTKFTPNKASGEGTSGSVSSRPIAKIGLSATEKCSTNLSDVFRG